MPADRPPSVLTTPSQALQAARRREKLSQAEWRRRRAQVARLVAAGEEAAARRLLAEIGVEPASAASPRVPRPASIRSAPPQPTDHQPNDSPPIEDKSIEGKSVEEKSVEGGPTGSTTGSSPRSDARAPQPHSPRKVAFAKAKQNAATDTTLRRSAPTRRDLPKPTRRQRKPPARGRGAMTWSAWFAGRPPWVTSLAVHGASLTLLGLMTFASLGDPGFRLIASLGEDDSWEEAPVEVALSDLAVDEPAEGEISESVELPAEAIDPASLATPLDLAAMTPSGDVLAVSGESLMAAVPAGESKGEVAGAGQGGVGEGAASGGGKVSFFGAEAVAECVVFVVDNSGSMQDGRMQVTLLELSNSIRNLSESQRFYVVFFSDQAYPMFYPQSVLEPLRATQENKQAVVKWLRTVEMCLGGRLLDAMEFAAQLKPEALFLLTDGDIRSPRVVERMTAKGAWEFPIHVLGMGARTPQHGQVLQAIAEGSGGTARPVNVAPEVVRRARARPIPYHNTPGKVWGNAVQPWD